MSKFRKIIYVFCVTLCFSLALMTSTSAFTFRKTDYMIRGSIYDGVGDVPVLGTVTQYKPDGSSKSVSFDYADADSLYEDSYGVYGFKYSFPGAATAGFTDYGTYKLSVSIPWTDVTGQNYFGDNDTAYRIDSLDLYFSCAIYYYSLDGSELYTYTQTPPFAQIVNTSSDPSYNSPIAETTSFADPSDPDGSFHIHLNGGTIVKGRQMLNLEISWDDKPSSNRKPYISFLFPRGASKLVVTPLDIYLSDVNSQIKDSFQKMKDYLSYDPLDYGQTGLIPSKALTLGQYIKGGSGDFYTFVIELAVLGSAVAMIGYVIHGKR